MIPMGINDLTFNGILVTVAVIVLAIGIYNTVCTALKNRRENAAVKSAPIKEIVDRLDGHDKMLDADKRRIQNLEMLVAGNEKTNERINEGLMALMRSSLAMTRHMRDGNNLSGLKESEKEITDYLTGR